MYECGNRHGRTGRPEPLTEPVTEPGANLSIQPAPATPEKGCRRQVG